MSGDSPPAGPAGPGAESPAIGRRIVPKRERARTFHGPVHLAIAGEGTAVQVLTFSGSEESDLLHAAADWMADHLYAVINALGFANLTEDDDETPQLRLTMAVDMSSYHAI